MKKKIMAIIALTIAVGTFEKLATIPSGKKLNSFNLCLDAVAVIVNKKNDKVDNLTIKNLYDIYTGKIVKFSKVK